MASLPHSPVTFSGTTASDLLRSSSNGVNGVPLKALGRTRLGVKRRDITVSAKIRKGKKHEYPWPDDADQNVKGGVLSHLSHFKPLKEKPKPITLDFERPLMDLEKKIIDIRKMAQETGLDFSDLIILLENKYHQSSSTPVQMANGIELAHCLLISIMIAHALSHGFVEGRAVRDRELVRHKAAVKTIESDGDVIDCVDIYKQPAFDNPLLKNHKIQVFSFSYFLSDVIKLIGMKPSSYPNGMKANSYTVKFTQPWHESGRCPEGTIPIKRTQKHDFPQATLLSNHRTKLGHNITGKVQDDGYEYAAVYESENKYYGAEGTINLRNPKLGDDSEMSLSEIWVTAGTSETLNTAEAGLMVYPELYGDNRTRLSLFWTSDNYVSKGCYSLDCPGFVQTNGNVTLGSILSPVSNYDAEQYSVSFLIFMDKSEGNWWLEMQGNFLGYWPSSIYTTMADGASAAYWGGVIFNSKPQGHHTTTQMGSGHFPFEGYGKSSYISNLGIVNSSNIIIDPVNLSPVITKSTGYDLYIGEDKSTDYGTYFYYGGPGYSKECP
ncbi:hypothetical protein HHK36_021721 [Tetracentron sinense]|uniref:Neprosin PEP catalytic domain-containing protein n=1 Tax=Tetracentron sinense TaxID=13715 RepID=A0A834YS48_TETSI|nr:hypothetical protein HHK36_021721 [Tetracentron sinense]